MYSHSKPIAKGTIVRSRLTRGEYIVVYGYDPTDIKTQATIVLGTPFTECDNSVRALRGSEFAIAADRFDRDFEIVSTS